MKIRKAERKQVLCAVAAAALLTAAAVSGVLNRADQTAADAWYQKPSASEGNIVLVGIDQKALEDIGPFQNWGRDTMAMVIEALNESEDCHPAELLLMYCMREKPIRKRMPGWQRRRESTAMS